MSVVVAIVSDTTDPPNVSHLERCLGSLRRQVHGSSVEVIVPWHRSVEGISEIRERYPEVCFLEVTDLKTYLIGSREHHDELRARGLAAARGNIIALIEDHGIPAPDWIGKMIESHRMPYAAIGGAVENGEQSALSYAVCFCDFLRYQKPFSPGESRFVSDVNVSYKRDALESIRPVWQEIFHETAVSAALRARGERMALDPSIVFYQQRKNLRFGSALRERFVWGRSYAGTRARLAGPAHRIFWTAFSPALPLLIMTRMTFMAWRKKRTFATFLRAWPLTAAMVFSWSCGELIGYATGRANARGSQAAEALARGLRAV